jgi:hypothetical protein
LVLKTVRNISLLLCLSVFAHAQSAYTGKVIAFGIQDTGVHKVTFDQIVKDHSVKCKTAPDGVTGFTISFLPKGGEYLGPFTIQGGQITDKIMENLNKIRSEHPALTKIFLEDILIKSGTKIQKAQSMIFSCTE